MKNYLPVLLVLFLSFTACKKDKDPVNGGTTPVEFNNTEYSYMGTYDDTGKPNYLVGRDAISPDLSSFIASKLPERGDIRKTNPDYLKNADLAITVKSDVFITFISEGTGYSNTVGYYLYKTGSSPKKPEDIEKVTYMFPLAQTNDGGSLRAGDKVKIGTIESGTSIGFVLIQKGWDFATKKVNDKAPHFCSNKELNPENLDELKAHTVLFEYPAENKVIIGFEDINRTSPECDHDFNDVVINATVVPIK